MTQELFRSPSPTWHFGTRSEDRESKLSQELGISKLVAAILVQRGLDDPQAAYEFLHPTLDSLGDPRRLPDYQKAVDAILGAKERNDLIFIHGDYDVDGVTSAAILHRFLINIGCNIHTHVPHRIREGYGIHIDAVDQAHSPRAGQASTLFRHVRGCDRSP